MGNICEHTWVEKNDVQTLTQTSLSDRHDFFFIDQCTSKLKTQSWHVPESSCWFRSTRDGSEVLRTTVSVLEAGDD